MCIRDRPKDALLKLLPKEGAVAGWHRRGEPDFYDRDRLFEYVDGAANAYLDNEFQGVATVDFLPAEGKDFITVDVYDMKDAAHAKRIYGKERCKAKPAGVGAESTAGPDTLRFRKGRYYVKLTASAPTAPFPAAMAALAKRVAGAIPGE